MSVTFSIPYNLPNVNQGGLTLSAWFVATSIGRVAHSTCVPASSRDGQMEQLRSFPIGLVVILSETKPTETMTTEECALNQDRSAALCLPSEKPVDLCSVTGVTEFVARLS